MKLARIVLAVLGTLFVVQGAVQLFQRHRDNFLALYQHDQLLCI